MIAQGAPWWLMNKGIFIGLLWVVVVVLQACSKDNVVTPQEQLKIDLPILSKFIADQQIPAVEESSGFWYIIDTVGTGSYPALSDSIMISYSARKIPSMTKVDTASSLKILLSSSISGFQLGVPLFPVGSRARLFLPSGLAFGANQHSGITPDAIAPNSNLIYEVRLLGVVNSSSSKLTADTTAIISYLNTQGIVAATDPTGIRYTIDSLKIDSLAAAVDSVEVTYTGVVLNGAKFISETKVFALKDQIAAWRIMLPKIAEGSMFMMYVPSGYGYGSNAGVVPPNSNAQKAETNLISVAPNSNLIYHINLIRKVIHH